MQYRRLFFRILYGSIYLVFLLLLVGLLLITPGDAIDRSLRNGQKYNVLILTISYVVTAVTVVFVYILRLYITKTALASIPKAWVPIDKGDVKDAVYRMIHSGLSRSAAIAYESRPREQMMGFGRNLGTSDAGEQRAQPGYRRTKTVAEDLGLPLPLPSSRPVWGEIEHYGWASPNSPDLRNLQYSSVLSELPNLIEARALTLAPTQSSDGTVAGQTPMPDPETTILLQRMPSMTMRDYLDHLSSMDVVPMDETTILFLAQYEHARFSNRPISNDLFRELMHLFAEILRAMQPFDPNVLQSLEEGGNFGWGPSESDMDIDNDAPLYTNPPSPQSSISRSTLSSVRRRPPMRTPSAQAWSFRTAPNTPGSRRTGILSRKSSENSFAQTRRQYAVSSQPSSSSLGSNATGSSDSGSVIRLATRQDPGALPYVLNLSPTAGS